MRIFLVIIALYLTFARALQHLLADFNEARFRLSQNNAAVEVCVSWKLSFAACSH